MKIEIKVLNKQFYTINKLGGSYLDTPNYATSGSAGVDLVCTKDIAISPQEVAMISTGLAVHIGSGIEASTPINVMGLIVPRSGLGTRGLVLANTIGVIDEDYQGEVKIAAWNRNAVIQDSTAGVKHGHRIVLKAGDRIAQLIFVPVIKAQWKEVEEFSANTRRGSGAFGSTGV